MQSTVALFNTALARLGGEQLGELVSPQEPDALGVLCRNLFPHVLDLALSAHAWSFAQTRIRLASVPAAEIDALYPYAYALPADCVRPLRLEGLLDVNRSPAFIVEGETLKAIASCATLVYVRRITDPRGFSPAFADALAWSMAAELASAKLNDSRKQQWAMQNYELALERAIARDCAGQNRLRSVSAWQAARFGCALPGTERY